MRVQRLVSVVAILAAGWPAAAARDCDGLDIRNNVRQFDKLRNCTKIIGFLQVVLIDIPPDYHDTFPELVEITHFLMFYRVYGLRSIGDLFPNLAIIRGQELFVNYALVIYEMKDLEEVGLYSLSRFRRGSARIEKNPNLCYVNTIDWERIGGTHHFITENRNISECPNKCPEQCQAKNCWNQEKCQNFLPSSCHKECVKSCTGSGNHQCEHCENLEDNGRCVTKCSPNTYHFALKNKCITKSECNAFNETWWTFQDECLNKCPPEYERVAPEEGNCRYCGSACPKVCDGTIVDSLASVQNLRECTFINGSLHIRINGPTSIEEELEENLGRIEEITGFLKVHRSFSIRSLNFFKNLKVIHGKDLDSKYYSLIVHENQNLQTLWDWKNMTFKIQILKGTFSFHYNPKLCISEIEKLREISGLKKNYSHIDVSPHSNGDKFPCKHVNIKAVVSWRSTDGVTLEWEVSPEQKIHALIGYLIYYIEASSKNITMFYGDACDDKSWKTIFISYDKNITVIRQNITQLKPFTQYAFYVSTNYNTGSGGQSPLQYFKTLSGDPSAPTNIEAKPIGSNSIVLSWDPPNNLNGILSHYFIVAYKQRESKSFLDERNFCNYPRQHEVHIETTSVKPVVNVTNNNCCKKQTMISLVQKSDFGTICSDLDKYASNKAHRSHSCGNYAYHVIQDAVDRRFNATDENFVIQKRTDARKSNEVIKIVDANSTSTVITDLEHYTIYVFLLTACNENRTEHAQCSSVLMVSQRSGKFETADNIDEIKVTVMDVHNVEMEWMEPPNPNGVIVSYNVEYKSTNAENDKTITHCVTRIEHEKSGYKFKFTNFIPDTYAVRVRANSLAGSGDFTKYTHFAITVATHSSVIVPIVVSVVLIVIIVVVFSIIYWRYRRQKQLDNMHLITRVNPEYAGYIEDEWEIERLNIEFQEELGQGTFGTVFSGVLKNKNIACAVKSVKQNATMHDKMEFLNEASVMKSFNDAHHVIRLLGVVSRGHQPLVVMELMARGDLKTYLRSTRESSTNLTCSEMYRMAAEIADGMTYLSAKKYVHRDLAARNCMVASDRTVKIGDFGMTRDVYETDYYRKETRGLLPVRWMAPESLADGVFTSDSDIWSYGIVLWEIATLAEQPYQGLSNEQVLQFVISKGTLERPLQCPDVLYDIMEVCWKWRPSNRPSFMEIVEKLETSVGQDFRLVSFYHSRDGEELRLHRYEFNRIRAAPALPMQRIQRVLPPVRWNKDSDQVTYMDTVDNQGTSTSYKPFMGYSSYPYFTK